MTPKNYIAIDISKDTLEVLDQQSKKSCTFRYRPDALQELLQWIQGHKTPLVVCEATGGYERELLAMLREHGVPAALVNPSRVRAFAKSEGLRAKSDPLDAALLLRFAQSKALEATPPLSPLQLTLQALLDRRSQLSEDLAREKNRLEKCPQCIRRSIQKMIRNLEKEIDRTDQQIEDLIAGDQTMSEQNQKMQSVVGVGKVTAWSILAYLREITTLSRNKLVALAGIAPFVKESGKYKGKRKIDGGRAKVRRCLYMAAQSAAVHNPHIKAYVERLRARGKPYKCAIVAAMRKLLLHLQSILQIPEKCLA